VLGEGGKEKRKDKVLCREKNQADVVDGASEPTKM